MPFPSNWTEELVCEFLELQGYFVITNLPVALNETAGRREMDVVGIKVEDNKLLKIMHIETGIPREISYEKISSKFGEKCRDKVEEIARAFGFKGNYTPERWYVDVARNPKGSGETWKLTKRKLKEDDIDLLTFDEILEKIVTSIRKWKKDHKLDSGRPPALPKNLWLLKLLEALLLLNRLTDSNGKVYR